MQWKSRLTADWLPSDPIMSRLFMDFSQIPQTPKKIWWRVSKPRRKPWNLSGRHHRANNRHNLFKKATIKSLCPSADLSRVLLCEIPTCFRPHPHRQTHRQSGTELCALVNKQLPFSSTLLRSSQVTPNPKSHSICLYCILYCIKGPECFSKDSLTGMTWFPSARGEQYGLEPPGVAFEQPNSANTLKAVGTAAGESACECVSDGCHRCLDV